MLCYTHFIKRRPAMATHCIRCNFYCSKIAFIIILLLFVRNETKITKISFFFSCIFCRKKVAFAYASGSPTICGRSGTLARHPHDRASELQVPATSAKAHKITVGQRCKCCGCGRRQQRPKRSEQFGKPSIAGHAICRWQCRC